MRLQGNKALKKVLFVAINLIGTNDSFIKRTLYFQ